uniref:DUF6955 family protein n=1 Tax=Pyrobaculum aerophilum TaxID=13773 RepID=UPI003A52257E
MLVLELDDALGELVLRRFPSAGVDARGFVEDLPASFRRVLFEELVARGEVEVAALVASDDGEVPPPWSLLWGFWWGFVGPLAGVGGGVFFTPLAVGLLGVDVNLARTGGLLVATSSVAGSLYL